MKLKCLSWSAENFAFLLVLPELHARTTTACLVLKQTNKFVLKKTNTIRCVFTHLDEGYVTAAGNFLELPVLVQVFSSFVPRCTHLEQELINFCT